MTDVANGQDQISLAQVAAREVLAATPPVTVWALTPNNVVAICTVVYILAQLAYLIWRWRRERKAPPRWQDDA